MKKLLLLFLFFAGFSALHAQAPTNSGSYDYLGKTYTAKYDTDKHLLTFAPEVSFEIYDQTGTCIKRGSGTKVDFRTLLKKGAGETTFTVRIYKKAKKKKFSRNASIKPKGEIGTLLVTDSL